MVHFGGALLALLVNAPVVLVRLRDADLDRGGDLQRVQSAAHLGSVRTRLRPPRLRWRAGTCGRVRPLGPVLSQAPKIRAVGRCWNMARASSVLEVGDGAPGRRGSEGVSLPASRRARLHRRPVRTCRLEIVWGSGNNSREVDLDQRSWICPRRRASSSATPCGWLRTRRSRGAPGELSFAGLDDALLLRCRRTSVSCFFPSLPIGIRGRKELVARTAGRLEASAKAKGSTIVTDEGWESLEGEFHDRWSCIGRLKKSTAT